MRVGNLSRVAVLMTLIGWGSGGPSDAQAIDSAAQMAAQDDSARPTEHFGSPFEAYAAGAWDAALEGFLDMQVERPEESGIAMNVGSAQYQMRDYAAAEQSFSLAASSGEPALRSQALYNLGNAAYRQGRLQEAVELYKAALEVTPEDEDAKFNLEFVRDEIRRRHEEAQKRQQESQENPQEEQQPRSNEEESSQSEDGAAQPESGQRNPGEPQPPSETPRDSDEDGLADDLERSAENPTDPSNRDSDGDGLADGAEDLNRNGRVDPGETDPNRADSDGDGVGDALEEGAGEARQSVEPPSTGELSPEEAERYLQALEEGQPSRQRAGRGQRRLEKDW